MSDTSGSPETSTPPAGAPAPVDNTKTLRVVAILVMIGSILGLLGTGMCFLAFAADSYASEMSGILLLIAPVLLFFAGCIWVCKALLDRLKK